MAARKNEALNYRPERRKYTEKSTAEVLGRVVQAKALAGIVRSVGDEAQQDQQDKTNVFDHMVKLFEGSHELGIPEKNRYVRFDAKTSKPADVIFRVMGMLTVPPKYEYIAPKGSAKDADRHDRIEKFLNAFPSWTFRKYKTRWDFQNRFWQLLMGYGYLQQSYLPTYWDKEVRKRRNGEDDGDYNSRIEGYKGYVGPPFFVESIDPRMVYPIRTKMGPEGYVKIYRVQRYEFDDAFARIGKWVEVDKDGKAQDIVELGKKRGLELPVQSDQTGLVAPIEYYELVDDVMCYYVVGDTVVHKYRHDGGMKIFPAYGLQTGFEEHRLAAMGILWAVRNEIPQYDFMRTLWMQKAYLDVFPQLLTQLAGDEDPIMGDDDKPQQWQIEPGTIKQIRGQLTSAMKEAGSGVDFRAALEMLAGDIDLATISGLARGIAGAQQPGYSINQLSQAMRSLWKPVIFSAELQDSDRAEHLLWCHKNVVQEKVSMFVQVEDAEMGRRRGEYYELDAEDIDEYCMVSAMHEPELPIDTQGNMLTWAQLYEKGQATWEEFTREGMRKTNPVQRWKEAMRDQARLKFLPKAMEDAEALGRVQLTNEIIRERGLDRLNTIGNLDIQALKAARAQQPAPGMQAGGPAPVMPGAPGGAPPNAAGPLGMQGMPGGPMMPPGEAGMGGPGIPPTIGANPNNPAPGPRMGAM